MPSNLTGDFDVVAQFAIPAANRLLAAMHMSERFPHSFAVRVDDNHAPGLDAAHPTLVGIMDSFGDPITNHQRIGRPSLLASESPSVNAAYAAMGGVVNLDGAVFENVPIEPSNLQGRAQLQLFPPTIEIPDSSGTNVTIRLEMIARYFPDPNTSPVAEFVRGELRVTAPVTQVASQVAKVVEIDIRSASVGVDFRPRWSSRPLVAEDLAAINLLIRNALKTSFLPSSSRLPSNIAHMQFRTIRGAGQAIAILLDTEGDRGNPASAGNVFLGGDDFAFGVGADFIHAAFQPTLDKVLTTPVDPVTFRIESLVHTWTITYTFALQSATLELEAGEIVLRIRGHARTSSWPPNFDFNVRAAFSLEPSGDTAELSIGDVSIDTSSWVINRFRGAATSSIRRVCDLALSQAGAKAIVRRMLSAEQNLGPFVDSLLQSARKDNAPPAPRGFALECTGVEIRAEGIVLRGSLSVDEWPAPHVEFEQIPMDGGGRFGAGAAEVIGGADYSALKTWIPGGTISRYEWKRQGQSQPGATDENRFVFLHQRPAVSVGTSGPVPLMGYAPLCVTVHGSRLSASGPVATQPVSATICGVNSFPVVGDLDANLAIALVEPGDDGTIRVAGHAAVESAGRGRVAPNLIVHFGGAESAADLARVLDGLSQSGRTDASTAVMAVLPAEDIRRARYTAGVTYAEGDDGAWLRRFGLSDARRPYTIVVVPNGKVVWSHEGEVDAASLSDALRRLLVGGAKVRATLVPRALRIGQLAPNFLFEYAKGHDLTLHKVTGRPVAVVFWRSASHQSLETLRTVAGGARGADAAGPLVLAVNDGESPEVSKRVFAEQKLSGTLVVDEGRQISRAYGVNTWPTTVWIDKVGRVGVVRIGSFSGEPTGSPFNGPESDGKHDDAAAQRSAR